MRGPLSGCICEQGAESFSRVAQSRDWPRYCRKVYWTKMVQNGPNDHFGQNDLIPNRILAFARPKWTKMVHFGPFWPEVVHFGPFRSANRTLAIPDKEPSRTVFSTEFDFQGGFRNRTGTGNPKPLVARAIRNTIRANRFARIDRN